MRTRRQTRSHSRGAATVEFALSVPILVMILLFSMYLTELVRVKLKLQEMARYAVWEMTSYALSDFANGDHAAAFEDARREAHEEWLERYRDLDSAEPNGRPGNLIARYRDVTGTLTDREIDFLETGALGNPTTTDGGRFVSSILRPISSGAEWMLDEWGFNNRGWVEADVRMTFDNVILPRSYLQEGSGGGFSQTDGFGGRSLASLPLRARYSMYANGWNLPDGGDAIIRSRRAGQHREGDLSQPHGLYQQVDRMVFLGLGNVLDELGLGSILDKVALVLPNFVGTFVVSRNYGIEPQQKPNCSGLTTYSAEASSGLHVMHVTDGFELVDHDRPDCFDTAPFRDEMTYGNSNYIKLFNARGAFFMGCKRAMADDPSAPPGNQEATADDEQEDKVACD